MIAATDNAVIVCEAKSKPTPEKARELLDSVRQFLEFFPEYKGRRIIPMMASIALSDELLAYMTRLGVLAVGLGDETMEVLNPEAAGREWDPAAGCPPSGG